MDNINPPKFNKAISSLIGILILVLFTILIVGVLIWQSKQEIPIWQTLKPKVTIATDKKEYEQGEIVKVTIKNNLAKSIWYKLDCGEEPFDVFKYENGDWKQIHQWLLTKCPAIPVIEEIKRGGIREVKYNGIWKGLFAIKGKYKIGLNYSLFKPENGKLKEPKTIYSNEFTIKEKPEVTIITDKREYEQGEVVKVIIKNFLEEPIVLINNYPFVFFEKFKNGKWIEVKDKQERCPLEPILEIPPFRIVKDNYEYTWLAKIKMKCDKDGKPIYENMPPGLYRAKATFLPESVYESVYMKKEEKNRQKEKTIYSNEFTIK
jgi:flagellin-like protein